MAMPMEVPMDVDMAEAHKQQHQQTKATFALSGVQWDEWVPPPAPEKDPNDPKGKKKETTKKAKNDYESVYTVADDGDGARYDLVESVCEAAMDLLRQGYSRAKLEDIGEEILENRAPGKKDKHDPRGVDPKQWKKDKRKYVTLFLRRMYRWFPRVYVGPMPNSVDAYAITPDWRYLENKKTEEYDQVIDPGYIQMNRSNLALLIYHHARDHNMAYQTIKAGLVLSVAHEIVHFFRAFLLKDGEVTPPQVKAAGASGYAPNRTRGQPARGESGRAWEQLAVGGIWDTWTRHAKPKTREPKQPSEDDAPDRRKHPNKFQAWYDEYDEALRKWQLAKDQWDALMRPWKLTRNEGGFAYLFVEGEEGNAFALNANDDATIVTQIANGTIQLPIFHKRTQTFMGAPVKGLTVYTQKHLADLGYARQWERRKDEWLSDLNHAAGRDSDPMREYPMDPTEVLVKNPGMYANARPRTDAVAASSSKRKTTGGAGHHAAHSSGDSSSTSASYHLAAQIGALPATSYHGVSSASGTSGSHSGSHGGHSGDSGGSDDGTTHHHHQQHHHDGDYVADEDLAETMHRLRVSDHQRQQQQDWGGSGSAADAGHHDHHGGGGGGAYIDEYGGYHDGHGGYVDRNGQQYTPEQVAAHYDQQQQQQQQQQGYDTSSGGHHRSHRPRR